MIENFYPKEEYGACRSTGCSCCSCEYNVKDEKDKILESARDNIRVVKKICEFYKIPFSKFCKDILTEKQCKKHNFKLKYKGRDGAEDTYACWKCDKWNDAKDKKKELK